MNNKPPAIFLMGATATGKTDVAVELVQRLPCEIISVDSAMVYRGMDIGTAKPDKNLLNRAPHRLIDIRDPSEAYSAASFLQDALREMESIIAQGRIPLLVGGTMLYFRALEQGLSRLPSADAETRARLDKEAEVVGWEAMHQRLAHLDPLSAANIHPNDTQRIQRALEVYELTGMPLSELRASGKNPKLPYHLVKINLEIPDRYELYQRIDSRFEHMMEQGFIKEVEKLYQRGDLHPGLPSIRTVGYKQLWDYMEGQLDIEKAVKQAKKATRNFAKRQLTWLRAEEGLNSFESIHNKCIDKVLKFLSNYPILNRIASY